VKEFLVLAISLSMFAAGCAPWMDAQSDHVTQARRGIELAQSNHATVAPLHDELARLKRQRLDDAFDADVRDREGRGELTAEWVIAHRAAYAAGLEAYAKQDQSLRASADVARRNLQAIDAALERLQFLHSIQNRWLAPARSQPEDEP
jgi:hypothetical protein